MLCRYGHQDFYRIMGRDPAKSPLSRIERSIFARCLAELWNNEVKANPASELGAPPPND